MPLKSERAVMETQKLKEPPMFIVIMHNDDYTPMDFVVELLMEIFNKENQEAVTIMLEIHEKGSSVVGKYVYDIAITKQVQATVLAEQRGFPLRITIEEEEK